MVLMKDIMWSFANAVSQVCVEDDGVSYFTIQRGSSAHYNSRASALGKS